MIPFRSGSKGLPGKNVRMLNGLPLWEWSLKAALAAETVDSVIVTTDSVLGGFAQFTKEVVFVRRPAELAQDETPLDAAVLHAIDTVGVDGLVVVLQPTVPVRRGKSVV